MFSHCLTKHHKYADKPRYQQKPTSRKNILDFPAVDALCYPVFIVDIGRKYLGGPQSAVEFLGKQSKLKQPNASNFTLRSSLLKLRQRNAEIQCNRQTGNKSRCNHLEMKSLLTFKNNIQKAMTSNLQISLIHNLNLTYLGFIPTY